MGEKQAQETQGDVGSCSPCNRTHTHTHTHVFPEKFSLCHLHIPRHLHVYTRREASPRRILTQEGEINMSHPNLYKEMHTPSQTENHCGGLQRKKHNHQVLCPEEQREHRNTIETVPVSVCPPQFSVAWATTRERMPFS